VRPNADEARELVESYNRHLRPDGYELVPVSEISGRPVYAAHSVLSVPASLRDVERATVGDRDYLARQITRMETSIETDPELAIGTAKELIETACKTILEHRGATPDRNWDVPRLMKEAAKELELTPEGVSDAARGADTIRRILGSLASVVGGTAELRNHYGSGHGRGPGAAGLEPRHARLVVGAASTLAIFLFETFEQRSTPGSSG
ncbi:MAG: abortive infection family protein, partial [Actinomycetota bacterium]|nr:abortive infection family protein [Actinomycetota bacterium]